MLSPFEHLSSAAQCSAPDRGGASVPLPPGTPLEAKGEKEEEEREERRKKKRKELPLGARASSTTGFELE